MVGRSGEAGEAAAYIAPPQRYTHLPTIPSNPARWGRPDSRSLFACPRRVLTAHAPGPLAPARSGLQSRHTSLGPRVSWAR
jgi:hypothetical protein